MTYASAVAVAAADIPIVDAGPLRGGDAKSVRDVGRALRAASETVGFFYIRNHGVAEATIAEARDAARAFYRLPYETKARVAINRLHRGYLGVGEAKMYAGAKIDLKESYLWGIDLGPDDADVRAGKALMGPNVWPDFAPGLRPACERLLAEFMACGDRVLMALAASLDVDPKFFVAPYRKPLARGSAVYYPPQPPDMGPDQFGVAPHTDYGGITLLWQDDVGGLQVKGRAGEWVTAVPVPDTLVINIGDLMARWTDDRFISNPHRVVNSSGRERQSIAVFYDPGYDTIVDPADLLPPGAAPHYPPIACGDYIVERFDRAFKYRKA